MDIIASDAQGNLQIEKLLSEAPSEYQGAAIEGIYRILKANHASLEHVKCVKMRTTVATNALLQRKGVSCALLITKGFKDLLRIGYQNRSDLFALNVKNRHRFISVPLK